MSNRRKDISTAGPETDENIKPLFSYDELLFELAAELAVPEIPPGSVTVRMLVDKNGASEKRVRKFLNKKVREGKMKYVLIYQTKYYYPVDDKI